jgi:predicted dehydrogenase
MPSGKGESMNKVFRVGGLGTGRIFNHAHVPAYVNLDSVVLAAVYDADRNAAEETRDHYLALLKQAANEKGDSSFAEPDVAVCSSAEELLDQVDIIDICAPVRWHAPYAAMALERNVHVMTEKPMARTWWEARHVAELARNSAAYFQLNDDNLFIPRYRVLRNVIEGGMIGDVQAIWLARGYHGTERNPWFWDPMESGGGCVMDYGTHAVTSTWFLVGYDKIPVAVRSLGLEAKQRTRLIGGRFQQHEIDDDAHFKVRFADPRNDDWISVVVEATWSWPELGSNGSDVRGYIEVQGTTGTATGYVDEHDQDFVRITNRIYGERLIPVTTVLSERESFQAEIDNFVKSIVARQPSILNADVGLGVMSMLDGAQLSELLGRRTVTPADLETFSRKTAGDAPDPWVGSDRILMELMAPYRLEK